MLISRFGFAGIADLSWQQVADLVGLVPLSAVSLTGRLVPSPELRRAGRYIHGLKLVYAGKQFPYLDPMSSGSDGRHYDSDDQVVGYAEGLLYEEIRFNGAGNCHERRAWGTRISSLKSCIIHYLHSGQYVGELVFLLSDSISHLTLTLRFGDFGQDDPVVAEVKIATQINREALVGNEERIVAAIEDAARQLPLLREEQPVLTGT